MKKIEEKELLKTPVFTVVKKTFTDKEGNNLKFQPVGLNCKDWVMVIARDKNNYTIIVRQTRWGMEGMDIEFPCGTVEDGEDPRVAAVREFREETGIKIDDKDLKEVLCFNPNPAYFNNKMHIYIAEHSDLFGAFNLKDHLELDEDEDCIPALAQIDDPLRFELSKHAMGITALHALNTF